MTRGSLHTLFGFLQDGFFVWVLLGCLWGYWQPELALQGRDYIAEMIGAIMLGMGMTLTRQELARLPIALAMAHFGVIAAVPGAIFSVWQNLFGAAFAAYHRRKSRATPTGA